MIFGSLDPRISQVFEVFDETQFRMRLHPVPYKQRYKKYKCQNGAPPVSLIRKFRCVCPLKRDQTMGCAVLVDPVSNRVIYDSKCKCYKDPGPFWRVTPSKQLDHCGRADSS